MQMEYWLIGQMLVDNSIIGLIQFLLPEHFYSRYHRDIFRIMKRMFSEDKPITPFNLPLTDGQVSEYKDQGGVTQYLAGAVSSRLCCINPIDDARHLLCLARKRELIQACNEASELMSDPSNEKMPEEHALVAWCWAIFAAQRLKSKTAWLLPKLYSTR